MINLKHVPSSLVSLKSKVHKRNFGKLETIPVDLKELIDVVNKEAVKKDMYDELVKKSTLTSLGFFDIK